MEVLSLILFIIFAIVIAIFVCHLFIQKLRQTMAILRTEVSIEEIRNQHSSNAPTANEAVTAV